MKHVWICMIALLGLFASTPAEAARPAMDPEIKLHAGVSKVAAPGAYGFMVGMDSRMTRFVYLDLGAFFSPVPVGELEDAELDPQEYFRLRHTVYILPGWRIPHKQPDAITWDVLLRVGPGVTWSASMFPNDTPNHENLLQVDSSGVAGIDAYVKKGDIGLRASGKFIVTAPFYESNFSDVMFWGTQFGLEALYQF
ncbi:MAG: hypothetical protein GY913_09350 [Proteobacteria bacterium]|nr:hypothetical protein [Pseudomonadota bacterium]MCP4917118.1 hypothetical protein [Pseudomonadota bacterium]